VKTKAEVTQKKHKLGKTWVRFWASEETRGGRIVMFGGGSKRYLKHGVRWGKVDLTGAERGEHVKRGGGVGDKKV